MEEELILSFPSITDLESHPQEQLQLLPIQSVDVKDNDRFDSLPFVEQDSQQQQQQSNCPNQESNFPYYKSMECDSPSDHFTSSQIEKLLFVTNSPSVGFPFTFSHNEAFIQRDLSSISFSEELDLQENNCIYYLQDNGYSNKDLNSENSYYQNYSSNLEDARSSFNTNETNTTRTTSVNNDSNSKTNEEKKSYKKKI